MQRIDHPVEKHIYMYGGCRNKFYFDGYSSTLKLVLKNIKKAYKKKQCKTKRFGQSLRLIG